MTDTKERSTSSQDLHPRPSIRRVGRLTVALTMVALLVVMTVLTFKYSSKVARQERDSEAILMPSRPLDPDQIERFRPPPEPPDLSLPEPDDLVAPTTPTPTQPAYPPPPRSSRRSSFEVRRPGGAPPRLSPGRETADIASVDVDSVRRQIEATLESLPQAAQPTPPGESTAPSARSPRQLTPSRQHAVHTNYQSPLTPFELKAGTYIPAVLTQRLSSELGGLVRAQVSRDVYDSLRHHSVLIPRGTVLLGQQARQPLFGERRLAVAWHRLLLPDGRSLDLTSDDEPMPATSFDGSLGVQGRVNRHWPRRIGTAALVSLVGTGVQLSQPQRSATGLNAASPEQLAAGELGLNLGRISDQLLNRTIDQPPTIDVAAGARIGVLITRDLAFTSPYTR